MITLAKPKTKVVVVLNSHIKSSKDANHNLETWLAKLPRQLFKSIAAVAALKQHDLRENTNGVLCKDGLKHEITMAKLSDMFVQAVASRRNHIPRESLNYQTANRGIIKQITVEQLKSF